MRTPVDHLDNEVRYYVRGHTDAFETLDEAQRAGTVKGVEIEYYCPYCDAPLAIVHSLPVPDGCVDRCSHCDREIEITPPVPGSSKQYDARDLEWRARCLERDRKARVIGERYPTRVALIDRWRRIFEPLYTTLSSLIIMAPFIAIPLSFALLPVNTLLAVVTIPAFVIFVVLSIFSLPFIESYVYDSQFPSTLGLDGTAVSSRTNFLRHGRKIARDEEALYVPPKSVLTEGERERELVTEQR